MIRRCCLFALALVLPLGFATAQEGYRLPPAEVVALADAPVAPRVDFSPDQRWMLMIERRSMPSISDLAQPMLRLAGRRINPNTNGRHGTSGLTGITIRSLEGGAGMGVDLPDGARLGFPRWAPDGNRFAFTITEDDSIRLVVCETATGDLLEVPGQVNGVAGGYSWMPDGSRLLVRFVPTERPPVPERSLIPDGPVIQESSARFSPVRTYQDLLRDPHDEALFDHYFTAQLALVDVAAPGGPQRRNLGVPAIFTTMSPNRIILLHHGHFVLSPYLVNTGPATTSMTSSP